MDWGPILLALKLATVTTVVLLLLGLPLARWLAFSRFRGKTGIEALVAMPLVLPPSVLGFYLLTAFSPHHAFGSFLQAQLDWTLAFTFEGLVVGSVLYSLPFMVQPLVAGFRSQPKVWREAAFTMGKSPLATFLQVTLPHARHSLLTAIVMSFAHTIGEFGVVLMIGGKLSGTTKVAAVAVFDHWERGEDSLAHRYALWLLGIAFVIILGMHLVNQSRRRV